MSDSIPVDQRWSAFADAIQSSDSNRVNDVIDEVKDMDLNERRALFDTCFEELTEIYRESDDGYVRQSVVRVTERLVPGLPVAVALEHGDPPLDADADDVRKQTDTLCGFLLEAITDDDGRVRQSAIRALQDVFRTYDALEDDETIEALVGELDEMAADTSESKQKHLREVKEHAAGHLRSDFGQVIRGLPEDFRESLQSDE